MFSPTIAARLRERGHDVIAVADDSELRAMTDADLLSWATERGRRVVTENVRDFRPLIGESPDGPGVLFTSSRTFPRSRRGIGKLVEALDAWLVLNAADHPVEAWLAPSK